MPISSDMLVGDWQRADPDGDPLAKQFAGRMPVPWKSGAAGSRLEFRVRVPEAEEAPRRWVAVYDLLGPGSGVVEVRVDGGAPRRVPRIDGYCTYWRIATLSLGDLAPGEHLLEVAITDETPDKKSILFERNRADLEKDPAKYAPRAWYASGLLIFGTAESKTGGR